MRKLALTLAGLALLLALGASPARAETIAPLGDLAPITSWRQEYVRTWNGEPIMVCQLDQESWARLHQVCHQLVDGPAVGSGSDLVAGRVLEDVIYDDTYYARVDQDPTWSWGSMGGFTCDYACWLQSFARSSVVSDLGRTTINGIAVRHIQLWSTDKELNAAVGGQYVDDYFISDDGYMIANGFSYRGNVPGFGQGVMAFFWVNSQFNAPITVGRPDAALLKPAP